MTELYENTYNETKHFSFGKNWKKYLQKVTPQRIVAAKLSLVDFYNGYIELQGKSFLDIGSGSGLFSLAAFQLGAKPITSVDADINSVEATRSTHERFGGAPSWTIRQGSILNQDFIRELGTFDNVYSWGVLHHTGEMWNAIENTAKLVAPGGSLYIAIYNERQGFQNSKYWYGVKRKYNTLSSFGKRILEIFFFSELCLLAIGKLLKRGPRAVTKYQTPRGMNVYYDLIDWLGGYPYEYSLPKPIINFLKTRGFHLVNLRTVGNNIGCNEFLFVRDSHSATLGH